MKERTLKTLWLQRPKNVTKLSCGRLLCMSGSVRTTFPAYLNLLAALRTGIGWMSLLSSQYVCNVINNRCLEVKTIGMRADNLGDIILNKLDETLIYEAIEQSQTLVIGSGLGEQKQLYKYILDNLECIKIPIVVDAAALAYFWQNIQNSGRSAENQIWTPNQWELSKMFGERFCNLSEKEKIEELQKVSEKYGMIWIYKGASPKVVTCMGILYECSFGNPGMATTGMGDVLCGVIGSFLAQGLNIMVGCQTSLDVLGMSGDLCYKKLGNGLRATDVCECLPIAINEIVK